MNKTELELHRKNTVAFINEDPITFVCVKFEPHKTESGGIIYYPNDDDTEFFTRIVGRIIPQTDVQPQVQTPDGIVRTPGFVIITAHDAVFSLWDIFTAVYPGTEDAVDPGMVFQTISGVRPEHTISENRYFRKADMARIF